jgi:hypothetical protein
LHVVILYKAKIKWEDKGKVVYKFLATDPEVPGSILGVTRFSEK